MTPPVPPSRPCPVRQTTTPRQLLRPTRLTAVALGATALVLAACGGSSSATSAPATTAPVSHASSTPTTVPGASGSIAAITGTSLEVQNTSTGQTTVTYTPTTTFTQTVPGSLSDVVVGGCISAFSIPAHGTSAPASTTPSATAPVDATTVSITQPVNGSCRGGFGGGFARPAGGSGHFPGASSGTTPGGGTRPPGAARRGFGGGASGSVTAVSGSTITVQEINPSTKATVDRTVVVSATTTFTQVVSAQATDLAVGLCVRAIGPADSTGAVTATSIGISTPGPNGCTAGFAGRGRFGGGSASGTAGTSA